MNTAAFEIIMIRNNDKNNNTYVTIDKGKVSTCTCRLGESNTVVGAYSGHELFIFKILLIAIN